MMRRNMLAAALAAITLCGVGAEGADKQYDIGPDEESGVSGKCVPVLFVKRRED